MRLYSVFFRCRICKIDFRSIRSCVKVSIRDIEIVQDKCYIICCGIQYGVATLHFHNYQQIVSKNHERVIKLEHCRSLWFLIRVMKMPSTVVYSPLQLPISFLRAIIFGSGSGIGCLNGKIYDQRKKNNEIVQRGPKVIPYRIFNKSY